MSKKCQHLHCSPDGEPHICPSCGFNVKWDANKKVWLKFVFSGQKEVLSDPVNHPPHYNSHPSGVECITVTRHMNFNLGNVIKYCWRTDHKNGLEDLKKARWYLDDEIKRLENLLPSEATNKT